MKKSFLLYLDGLAILNELSDEEAGILLKAVYYYQIGIDFKIENRTIKILFSNFKNHLDRDSLKYEEICHRRAEFGKAGGLAKANNKKSLRNEIKQDKFKKPEIQEVVDFFIEKDFSEDLAKKAFEYYETANWTDSTGKKVKNWKQKMLAVWMKPENKKTSERYSIPSEW